LSRGEEKFGCDTLDLDHGTLDLGCGTFNLGCGTLHLLRGMLDLGRGTFRGGGFAFRGGGGAFRGGDLERRRAPGSLPSHEGSLLFGWEAYQVVSEASLAGSEAVVLRRIEPLAIPNR